MRTFIPSHQWQKRIEIFVLIIISILPHCPSALKENAIIITRVFISLLAFLTKHKRHIHEILQLHTSILYQHLFELLATITDQRKDYHGTRSMTEWAKKYGSYSVLWCMTNLSSLQINYNNTK